MANFLRLYALLLPYLNNYRSKPPGVREYEGKKKIDMDFIPQTAHFSGKTMDKHKQCNT